MTAWVYTKQKTNHVPLAISLVAVTLLIGIAIVGYPAYQPLPQWTGILSAHILNAIGILSVAWGDFLIVDSLPPLKISAECSGIVLLLVFPLTIFLVPIFPIQQRVASLFFVPVLFIGNTLRIVTDVIVGKYIGTSAILLYHDSIGQVLIFFIGIMSYLVWLIIFGNFPKDLVVHKIERFGRFK